MNSQNDTSNGLIEKALELIHQDAREEHEILSAELAILGLQAA